MLSHLNIVATTHAETSDSRGDERYLARGWYLTDQSNPPLREPALGGSAPSAFQNACNPLRGGRVNGFGAIGIWRPMLHQGD